MFYQTFGLIGGLFPPFAVTVMLGIAYKAISITRFFIRSPFFVKNIYNFVIMLLLKNSNLSP